METSHPVRPETQPVPPSSPPPGLNPKNKVSQPRSPLQTLQIKSRGLRPIISVCILSKSRVSGSQRKVKGDVEEKDWERLKDDLRLPQESPTESSTA